MRILFATSIHPAELDDGTEACLREYLRELQKRADVRCVVLDWDAAQKKPDGDVACVVHPHPVLEVFSPESRFIEAAASLRVALSPLLAEFRPEVIHCADAPAFLPFRFDRNVLFAAGISEDNIVRAACASSRTASNSRRAALFRDARVERCAVAGSAVLTVPSDFAAESAERLAGGMCCPIVLPPGLPEQRRAAANAVRREKPGEMRTVAFFGRLEDARSGVNDFIYAVNQLGEGFKRRNNIRYELHGSGLLPFGLHSPLIDVKTADGSPDTAFRRADIVVLPRRDAAFGISALDAMAAGALVLLPPGLGMDSFAEPEVNCIPISQNYFEIADAIQDAVERYGRYRLMRDNARRTAHGWSMSRCVRAYLAVYREICRGRIPQLCSAHRKESRGIMERYRKTSDVEKIYCAEQERRAAYETIRMLAPPENSPDGQNRRSGRKTLVLTGIYAPDADTLPEDVVVVPTLDEQQDGTLVRPECLPFQNGEFDDVIAVGALESSVDPCGSLVEMQRVAAHTVVVLQYKGTPHAWQTYRMEGDDEWKRLSGSGWSCTVCREESPEKTAARTAEAPAIAAFSALPTAPFLRSFSTARYSRINADIERGSAEPDGKTDAPQKNSAEFADGGSAGFGSAPAEAETQSEQNTANAARPTKSILHGIAALSRTGASLPYQIVVYSRRGSTAAVQIEADGGTA